MQLAEAFIKLRADRSELDRDLKKVETSAKSTGASIAAEFRKLFAAAAFTAGIKKAIDSASNLNETLSKSKIIFGDAADEMSKLGDKAARSMGMSKRAYLDAAAGLKGLLDNMGLAADESTKWSQDLTALGSDLASFFNTDPADAIYAIGAALRGETEPIRRYNVQLSEQVLKEKARTLGLYEGKGALDSNAKAQAALAVIMEQTTAAQGDFTRTADGLANQQRINKALAEDSAASFGETLLPVMERVTQVVGFLAENFGKLPPAAQIALVGLVGFVAVGGKIGSMVKSIQSVTTAIKNMGTATKLSMGAIGLLVTAATLLYAKNEREKAKLTETTNQFVTALKAEEEGQKGAVRAQIASMLSDKDLTKSAKEYGLSVQQLADIITGKVVPAYEKLADENRNDTSFFSLDSSDDDRDLTEAGIAADKFIDKLEDLKLALSNAREQVVLEDTVMGELATSLKEVDRGADSVMGRHQDLAVAQEQAAAAAESQTAANEALGDAIDNIVTPAVDEAAIAMSALRDAIDQVFSPTLDLETASRNLAAGVQELTRHFTEVDEKGNKLSTTLDINTERGIENRAAIRGQVDAALELASVQVAAGGSIKDAGDDVKTFTDNLRLQLGMLGLNTEEVEAYITELGLTPENITTTIALANDTAAMNRMQEIKDRLGEIDEGAAAEIQALVDEGSIYAAEQKLLQLQRDRTIKMFVNLTGGSDTFKIIKNARGGYKDKAELGVYGEAGPEAILPLTNESRLQELLSDPRIAEPVAAAMGANQTGGGGVAVLERSDPSYTINLQLNDRTVQSLTVRQSELRKGQR